MLRRVAIVGDTHADQSSRLEEHNRVMSWIARDAADRGCTHALHSGDVWEGPSSVTERLAVSDYVRAFAENMAFAIIGGNHDNLGDIEWMGRLRGVHQVVSMTRPGVIDLEGVSVACLPWPRKAHLLAALGITSREAGDQAAVQALRNVLLGLGQELAERSGPRMFLGHVQMRGSRTSLSQPPLTGCDFELGIAELALVRAAFYALGHIHLGEGNEWDVEGAPAAFPGSPFRKNHGEIEPFKGYIIATFKGDVLSEWERIATPCTPMVHVSAAWSDGTLANDFDTSTVSGAEVRLRYSTAHDQRDGAALAAAALEDAIKTAGALKVKVEPLVITEQRARAPELAKAITLDEKLAALWTAKGFEPGARRESLLDKVHQLEELAHAS